MPSVGTLLRVALGGAIAATAGDLLQLSIATEILRLPERLLGSLLLVGTVLGVLGIPQYAYGYSARAALALSNRRRWKLVTIHGGRWFAAFGCAVHGATGLFLALVPRRGHAVDPYQGILESGPILLSLWGIASLAFLAATVAELRLCRNWRERAFNPLVLTLAIVLIAELFPPELGHIVGPASVNIAHVFFFAFHLRQANTKHRDN